MSSQKNNQLDPVVTESVLDARLQKYFQKFSMEIIQGVQTMFDEQDRKNDLKFATKIELSEIKEKVDKNYDLVVNIVGDIKAILENQTASDYRQSQHSDQLEEHETKIATIENHLGLTA